MRHWVGRVPPVRHRTQRNPLDQELRLHVRRVGCLHRPKALSHRDQAAGGHLPQDRGGRASAVIAWYLAAITGLNPLLTLRQQHLPVKVVVFNNGALGFVELEMKAAGIVTYGTDLDNPDFAGIAKSAGLFGATVAKADELEDALRAAFGHDGPALVDVRTARQELALPPKLTFGQIKGFTLYATRTILSDGGEELVELAKTNLRELAE
jgi:hypothetical protein